MELLHHGLKVVHGEIRADAFHFNRDSGVVKLVNLGSGPGSFEHWWSDEFWLVDTVSSKRYKDSVKFYLTGANRPYECRARLPD